MKNSILLFFLFFCYKNITAQDSIPAVKRFFFSGYLKSLENLSIDKLNKTSTIGNLLHNRLNLKWKPSGNISFVAEFRNRLFWGEQVKQVPDFATQLRNDNEGLNLQKAWISRDNLVLHSNTERLYVDLKKDAWTARIGRQRVNWGIATTWNPNDIYNAYNFLDVDYEERPGADAVNIQHTFSGSSHLEFVYSTASNHKNIAAARYFVNKWNYDMQFISGIYNGAATAGLGWAGNIKEAGFKGELQYYFPDKDSASQMNITLGIDYMFKKGWYVSLGTLYNSRGLNSRVSSPMLVNLNLTAKNLMPAKYNFMITGRKEITPLSAASFSVLYSPGLNLLVLLPGISYSLSSQLDADLIWQSFYLQTGEKLQGVHDIGYLRLKWSFGL